MRQGSVTEVFDSIPYFSFDSTRAAPKHVDERVVTNPASYAVTAYTITFTNGPKWGSILMCSQYTLNKFW
jgi:hypothetical protein